MKYWLMKSEPSTYSLKDLKEDKKALWDGVRNYQARNFMIRDMKKGDLILFYHSSIRPPQNPGVVGLAKVVREKQIDPTAFDKKSPFYDSKSSPEKPRWWCVEIAYVKSFKKEVNLPYIKAHKKLKHMLVAQKGQRLSIQPVKKEHFDIVVKKGV